MFGMYSNNVTKSQCLRHSCSIFDRSQRRN